jgi:hypothetical protein
VPILSFFVFSLSLAASCLLDALKFYRSLLEQKLAFSHLSIQFFSAFSIIARSLNDHLGNVAIYDSNVEFRFVSIISGTSILDSAGGAIGGNVAILSSLGNNVVSFIGSTINNGLATSLGGNIFADNVGGDSAKPLVVTVDGQSLIANGVAGNGGVSDAKKSSFVYSYVLLLLLASNALRFHIYYFLNCSFFF